MLESATMEIKILEMDVLHLVQLNLDGFAEEDHLISLTHA